MQPFRLPVSLILLLLLAVPGCKEKSENPVSADIVVAGRTLSPGEIVQIDEYPLFVMNYDGSYGFQRSMRTGPPVSMKDSEPWGCTCFSAGTPEGTRIFGRNFDFENHHASMILFTHPPGAYRSMSSIDLWYAGFSQNSTADEISASGSVPALPYLPFDGVNEKGVSIGLMAVPDADPPYDASKRSLSCLELIRLVLDFASSTAEAVALMQNYNYRDDNIPCHFLVADKSGASAIIEYVDHEMKVIMNDGPFQVSTNFIVTGSSAPQSTGCWRYDRAYGALSASNGSIASTEAMALLDGVSQQSTMWSAVYSLDVPSLTICVGRKYGTVYTLALP